VNNAANRGNKPALGQNPNWEKLHQMQLSGHATVQFPTQFDMVRMFHILGDVPANDIGDEITLEMVQRRINIINEEVNDELIPALEKLEAVAQHPDAVPEDEMLELLADVLDQAVDSCYVIIGTCVELGLPYDTAFAMVQEANLQKVKDGVVKRDDGKILKPERWKPANLKALLVQALQIRHEMQKNAESKL
jgi:predicted HAD superfamily Cof-like phosphohydrolase